MLKELKKKTVKVFSPIAVLE